MPNKLFEAESGKQVTPGMRVLSNRREIYEVISFEVVQKPFVGRVRARHVESGIVSDHFPSIFGLEIR